MAASEKNKKSSRILIVDDEENILELLDTIYSEEGFEVRRATTGVAALKLIEKIEFDLVVTDHQMPELTGIEFFRTAKKLQPGIEKRFLFISGRLGDQELRQLADETHAAILFKPFTLTELRNISEVILKRARDS